MPNLGKNNNENQFFEAVTDGESGNCFKYSKCKKSVWNESFVL